MRAMVLTAGFGTRLGELTRAMPKPMLRVAGRPLAEYVMRNLVAHGCDEAWLNLHFMPEVIREHFGDGQSLGLTLHYSHEPVLLGTAGGARRMFELAGQPEGDWLVHYGDVLTDQDLAALRDVHVREAADITMLVHERPGSNSVAVLDPQGRVTRFLERPSEQERQQVESPWVNSGIAICRREVLDSIAADTPSDWARDVLPRWVAAGRVFALPLSGFRCAIDSAERLRLAEEAVASGRCRAPWRTQPPRRGRRAA